MSGIRRMVQTGTVQHPMLLFLIDVTMLALSIMINYGSFLGQPLYPVMASGITMPGILQTEPIGTVQLQMLHLPEEVDSAESFIKMICG